MIDDRALCARFARLELSTLHRWVELGWVRPERRAEALAFGEADVARVALLCDLRFELALEEESLPVVLSLLDQVYDLRRQLARLLGAVQAQPAELRERLLSSIAAKARSADDEPA